MQIAPRFRTIEHEHTYKKTKTAVREGRVPAHDVLVTNPPYSGDHVERLLRWCRGNGRPMRRRFNRGPVFTITPAR